MWPARVGGNIPPNGASPLAGRVRRKVPTLLLDLIGKPHIYQPRIDHGKPVTVINFPDALHSRQGDDDPAPHRQTTSREASARPTGQKGNFGLMTDLYYLRYLVRVVGKYHHLGLVALDGETVALIHQQLRVVGNHPGGTNHLAEFV